MKGLPIVLALLLASASVVLAQNSGKGSESGDAPGRVVVVNGLDRAVKIWVNGQLRGEVAASGEASFHGIPAGRVNLQAGGVGVGGPVASEERAFAPGETFTWTLYPILSWEEERGTGTVVLVNALEREVDVFLGENVAGKLAPGGSRAYPRVVAGEVEVKAVDAEGKVLEARKLSVVPHRLVRWVIGGKEPEKGTPAVRRATRGTAERGERN